MTPCALDALLAPTTGTATARTPGTVRREAIAEPEGEPEKVGPKAATDLCKGQFVFIAASPDDPYWIGKLQSIDSANKTVVVHWYKSSSRHSRNWHNGQWTPSSTTKVFQATETLGWAQILCPNSFLMETIPSSVRRRKKKVRGDCVTADAPARKMKDRVNVMQTEDKRFARQLVQMYADAGYYGGASAPAAGAHDGSDDDDDDDSSSDDDDDSGRRSHSSKKRGASK